MENLFEKDIKRKAEIKRIVEYGMKGDLSFFKSDLTLIRQLKLKGDNNCRKCVR